MLEAPGLIRPLSSCNPCLISVLVKRGLILCQIPRNTNERQLLCLQYRKAKYIVLMRKSTKIIRTRTLIFVNEHQGVGKFVTLLRSWRCTACCSSLHHVPALHKTIISWLSFFFQNVFVSFFLFYLFLVTWWMTKVIANDSDEYRFHAVASKINATLCSAEYGGNVKCSFCIGNNISQHWDFIKRANSEEWGCELQNKIIQKACLLSCESPGVKMVDSVI